jgi:hypothetical protein
MLSVPGPVYRPVAPLLWRRDIKRTSARCFHLSISARTAAGMARPSCRTASHSRSDARHRH